MFTCFQTNLHQTILHPIFRTAEGGIGNETGVPINIHIGMDMDVVYVSKATSELSVEPMKW